MQDIQPPIFLSMIQEIDRGATGCVWLCRDNRIQDPAQNNVAVKFIRRGSKRMERVKREVLIVRKLYHKHVALFREVVLSPTHLCLLFNYVPGGNLERYLVQLGGVLPEHLARFLFQQLVLAVDFCHRVPPDGIMNRDLKLQNVLVQDPKEQFPLLLLCDFGFGKESGADPTVTELGTQNYVAPEVVLRMKRSQRYDGKLADIFSLGVCLHKMALGQFPRYTRKNGDMVADSGRRYPRVTDIVVELQGDLNVLNRSPNLVRLLKGLLHPDPRYRLMMDEIWEDEWFCTDLPINPDGRHVRAYNEMMLTYLKEGALTAHGQSEDEVKRMVDAAKDVVATEA